MRWRAMAVVITHAIIAWAAITTCIGRIICIGTTTCVITTCVIIAVNGQIPAGALSAGIPFGHEFN